jgi:hypothetical protein
MSDLLYPHHQNIKSKKKSSSNNKDLDLQFPYLFFLYLFVHFTLNLLQLSGFSNAVNIASRITILYFYILIITSSYYIILIIQTISLVGLIIKKPIFWNILKYSNIFFLFNTYLILYTIQANQPFTILNIYYFRDYLVSPVISLAIMTSFKGALNYFFLRSNRSNDRNQEMGLLNEKTDQIPPEGKLVSYHQILFPSISTFPAIFSVLFYMNWVYVLQIWYWGNIHLLINWYPSQYIYFLMNTSYFISILCTLFNIIFILFRNAKIFAYLSFVLVIIFVVMPTIIYFIILGTIIVSDIYITVPSLLGLIYLTYSKNIKVVNLSIKD